MRVILYLFIIILLVSCNEKTKKFPNTHLEFTNDIISLNNYSVNDLLKKNEFTLILYTDGECGHCINQVIKWKELFPKLNKQNNMSLINIVSARSQELAKYSIFDNANSTFPTFYDEKNVFLNKNNLKLLHKTNRTFLLNKKKFILVYSNPLNNEEVLNLYRKKLQ